PLFTRRERELADLRDAVDQLGDFAAELALEVGLGRCRVLQHVVQEAGGHCDDVHLEVDEEVGDLQWMAQIGLTGGSLLALMGGGREPMGAAEDKGISGWLRLWNF